MNALIRVLGAIAVIASLLLATPAHAVERITYYHLDALGSPVAASDETGNVYVWKETYAPYGSRLQNQPNAAPNTRWFTGHEQDKETGLIYAGARYYDPTLGRFLGPDPKGYTETSWHSFNQYEYGNNNPYKYVDPDGQFGVLYVVPPIVIGVGAALLMTPEQRAQMANDVQRLGQNINSGIQELGE